MLPRGPGYSSARSPVSRDSTLTYEHMPVAVAWNQLEVCGEPHGKAIYLSACVEGDSDTGRQRGRAHFLNINVNEVTFSLSRAHDAAGRGCDPSTTSC
ncbi:hypothetical protein NDU88_004559 [Pleurodeles waltl]|uniref:Uncharacterized protein n=1 Tax=Pleurodeles waltl TaxID=8319 RepID=A0AAV7TSX4_PLEWA|nr:hypothetical protein NDU88_004559 [Pleurodeles waltl]